MKVFVTGVKGQLGHDVVNELRKRNHEAIGVDIEEMDITDKTSVDRVKKQILMLSSTALHGQPSMLRKMRIKKRRYVLSMLWERSILQMSAKS